MTDFRKYADLDHTLLQELRAKAPGTYFHSQAVAQISFAVVEALKEGDPFRALVGAYFHDIGKMIHADLYSENGFCLTAEQFLENRELIMNHPNESRRLAQQAGLPEEIMAFMFSHHGTSQAFKFSKTKDGIEFYYDGPKPSCIEEIVVMLVDGLDASVRSAIGDGNVPGDFSEIIDLLWEGKASEEQLSEVALSDELIQMIKQNVNRFAKAFYHTR